CRTGGLTSAARRATRTGRTTGLACAAAAPASGPRRVSCLIARRGTAMLSRVALGNPPLVRDRCMSSPSVSQALARWRNNLIDLPRRNPLLALRQAPSASLVFSYPGVAAIWQRLGQQGK